MDQFLYNELLFLNLRISIALVVVGRCWPRFVSVNICAEDSFFFWNKQTKRKAPPNCRGNVLCTSSTKHVINSRSLLPSNLDWTWAHDNILVSVSPIASEKMPRFFLADSRSAASVPRSLLHAGTILCITVIPRLTKIIRSGITFVNRNLR